MEYGFDDGSMQQGAGDALLLESVPMGRLVVLEGKVMKGTYGPVRERRLARVEHQAET